MKRKLENGEVTKCSSTAEKYLIDSSIFDAKYGPVEKMRAVFVDNFPALGKAAALRFLEWAQQNPEGVCSLPTGKTPEYFIKWVQKFLKEWDTLAVQQDVQRYGLQNKRPDLSGLTFVQIDEFYPMSPQQENSFNWYVNEFYIKGFGLDKSKALLMDCSKIGLETTAEKRHGITGEVEDALTIEKMEDVWPDGSVDLTLRTRDPASRLERIQQRVLRGV